MRRNRSYRFSSRGKVGAAGLLRQRGLLLLLMVGLVVGPIGSTQAVENTVGNYANRTFTGQRVVFYGGLKTWGTLAYDNKGNQYQAPQDVGRDFRRHCYEVAVEINDEPKCQADLIVYTPDGFPVTSTEAVAREIIAQGGEVFLNFRPSGNFDNDKHGKFDDYVYQVFSGQTEIVSGNFIREHPIGFSLDPEAYFTKQNGVMWASEMNEICHAYRRAVEELGGFPLGCRVYDMGYSTLIVDPENLEPWLEAIHMGIGEQISKEQALAYTREEYWPIPVGCMVFVHEHLGLGQRDRLYQDAIDYLKEQCNQGEIWAFQ